MIRGGDSMPYSIFPLWRVRHGKSRKKAEASYLMAPRHGSCKKGCPRVYGARAAARHMFTRQAEGARVFSVVKVSDHPIVRGDEWLANGLIRVQKTEA